MKTPEVENLEELCTEMFCCLLEVAEESAPEELLRILAEHLLAAGRTFCLYKERELAGLSN